MKRKRFASKKIILMLREAEISFSQGLTVVQVCRQTGISEQTYYRWRKQYGGMKTSQARRMKELERENGRLNKAVAELTLDKLILDDIIRLAIQYGRYGYRRIETLLREAGWQINHKRVLTNLRQERLKVPKKQPKRGRLSLNDESCIRLRPTHRYLVWSYDFVMDCTHNGRPIKILTVIDEYSRECMAIVVDKKIKSMELTPPGKNIPALRGLFKEVDVDHFLPSIFKSSRSVG